MDIESAIRERFQNLEWALDERLRRLYAASEAKVLGHGGITLVQKATGVARNSIKLWLKELLRSQQEGVVEGDVSRRLRRVGGGRKATIKGDLGDVVTYVAKHLTPQCRTDKITPCHARLDVPGALHHIMIRGIDKTNIFCDAKDKERFLERLEKIFQESQCVIYAWVLMDNHVDLLFRSGQQGISAVMVRTILQS